MSTEKIVFFVLASVAVVLLGVRYLRRWRAERAQGRSAVAAPHLVMEGRRDERYVPSAVSRAYGGTIPVGRPLFSSARIDSNALPRISPEDVPTADLSECTYGRATPVLAALLPESPAKRETIRRELQSAGYYGPYAWHNLAATRYLLMMGSIVLFGALLLLVPRWMEAPVMAAIVSCAIIGWSVPRLMVRSQSRERLAEIERAMPDMLDMLNMSVSQGMTVQESLGQISAQLRPVSPALAQEMQIVAEQAELGSLEQALTNFGQRIDLPEVHSFTTLITQTERMGTSVSDALQQYSDTMRDGLRQRADEKANSASFRLLFPTVLFLMPAVFIFLLGPAIIELSDFFGGRGREMLTRNRNAVQSVTTRSAPPR